MKLLLDTHTLLWFLRDPDLLPPKIVEQIQDSGTEAAVSIASLWEIAIKVSLNKLNLPGEYEDLFPHAVTESGLSLLSIEPRHLAVARRLPLIHRDPFDRLLIAQAKAEGMTLVSRDSNFAAYNIPLLW